MSTEPEPQDAPEWAVLEDVYATAGPIGSRIRENVQAGEVAVKPDAQLRAARAEVATRLGRVYGKRLPEFSGDGLEVVRWAVARVAAANLLDILGASVATAGETAERLRRTAWASIDDGVPGWPKGDTSGPDGPERLSGPRVSSRVEGSVFADPYEAPAGYVPSSLPWWA